MPTFIPPVVNDVPPLEADTKGLAARLFRYYGPYPRGRSVLRINGEYGTYDTPDQTLIDMATEVYLGGHVYEVTADVANTLTASGYTVLTDEGLLWEVL